MYCPIEALHNERRTNVQALRRLSLVADTRNCPRIFQGEAPIQAGAAAVPARERLNSRAVFGMLCDVVGLACLECRGGLFAVWSCKSRRCRPYAARVVA